MAAYDLRVQNPAMLRVPQNQGAQNLMQFMRIQQADKNARDSLALEERKADNLNQQRQAELELRKQTAADSQSNANRIFNQNQAKFDWDKGADERGRVAQRNLNTESQGFIDAARAIGQGDTIVFGFTIVVFFTSLVVPRVLGAKIFKNYTHSGRAQHCITGNFYIRN